jgi:RNA polymerase sigma factor (sigma-70 family)
MDINGLVRQLVAGDDSAGPILVSIFAPGLLGHAAQMGPDLSPVERELLVERAIDQAIARIDQFDARRASLKTWVQAIVRNEMSNWRRDHPQGPPVSLVQDLPLVTPGENEGLDEAKDRRSAAIASIVLLAPQGDQLIIYKRFVETLSHAEIAKSLGIREETSRKRLERALNRLREEANKDSDITSLLRGEGQ